VIPVTKTDVPMLLVSLAVRALVPAPVVLGECSWIWKLCELVVIALIDVESLGTGLCGVWSDLDAFDISFSELLEAVAIKASWTLSPDTRLTLALTRSRLLMGSSEMTLGFGFGT
jgi:hypothetical protein